MTLTVNNTTLHYTKSKQWQTVSRSTYRPWTTTEFSENYKTVTVLCCVVLYCNRPWLWYHGSDPMLCCKRPLPATIFHLDNSKTILLQLARKILLYLLSLPWVTIIWHKITVSDMTNFCQKKVVPWMTANDLSVFSILNLNVKQFLILTEFCP